MSDTKKGSKTDTFYTTEEYDDALANLSIHPEESEQTLLRIITTTFQREIERQKTLRMREDAIYQIATHYAKNRQFEKITQLMVTIRSFFDEVSRPRQAKIVRTLIDYVADVPDSTAYLITLLKDSIKWCIEEKRTFLRQRLQARLAAVLCDDKQYRESLMVIRKLMAEVKKVDDKPIIVDLQLTESSIFYQLRNYAKSRGALTYARSTANGYYCPPLTTALIEFQAGLLSCSEKDYSTAESYFHESLDNFLLAGDAYFPRAAKAFKYSLLCKILGGLAGDVPSLINSRGDKFASRELQAIEELASVYQNQTLGSLDELLAKYTAELQQDQFVFNHLEDLREQLLEQSIQKIILPYSRVDTKYISDELGIDQPILEAKISQLILDGRLQAVLDSSSGDLILVDPVKPDELFVQSHELFDELDSVVDNLTKKVAKFTAV